VVTATSDSAILALDGLTFRWDRAQPACLDIDRFRIDAGERVFLHGPSGSGKSTLLALLGGILMPQKGSVRVLGTDLTKLSAGERDRFRVDHIGFIFQQFNLIPYLSVFDNVLLPCRFSSRRRLRAAASGTALIDEAVRVLDHLGLGPELRDRPVTALSVGQQQRVAAARALIGRPEILIADEPTSSLDAERQNDFLDLLLKECDAAQATLLFVSHDRRLATHFTSEVSLLDVNRAAAREEA
jgi:putative ABC transport system ATP-binding protein